MIIVVGVFLMIIERRSSTFVISRDELAQGSQSVVDLCPACFFDEGVVYFALGLAGCAGHGARFSAATFGRGRLGDGVLVVVVVFVRVGRTG